MELQADTAKTVVVATVGFSLTLNDVVMLVTILYICVQMFVLIRDKFALPWWLDWMFNWSRQRRRSCDWEDENNL